MSINKLTAGQSLFLDIVRLSLSLVVVIGHGFGFFLNYFDGFFPRNFPHPQSIAVVCFFYLSGFLIVGSQLNQKNNQNASLSRYLFDRTARVYITLIPSVLFVAVADAMMNKLSPAKIDLVVNYSTKDIFLDNLLLLPSMPFGTMRPIWSLMYEWWVYLLFGGFFFVRDNKFIASVLITIGIYYTFGINAKGEAGHIWIIWLLGGICAYIHQKIPSQYWRRHRFAFDVFSMLLLAAALVIFSFVKNAYYLPAGLCMSIFIFLLTVRVNERLTDLNLSWLRYFVGSSFTLFLTHYTVLTFVKEVVGLSGWLGLWVGFSLSCVTAFSIAIFSELKLFEIKQYIRPKLLGFDEFKRSR